jgi:hypothetical protein
MDAAGHANISITSTDPHVVIDAMESVGNLFGAGAPRTVD